MSSDLVLYSFLPHPNECQREMTSCGLICNISQLKCLGAILISIGPLPKELYIQKLMSNEEIFSSWQFLS